ncbi:MULTISPECIES: LON peptidase substrate-binding domain-containing protein [Alkalimonas]|uniref:LON peptidase substrate-binding domain-containing protein n=1 Tax=Alkalimonas mucilaginosa TaxID=3057676 RepID=A0ABU7JJB9_9GAMM|nr:LON peptidase substrate-binding domain-containing protein [Alkalimonas sp. MEB004]MEE2025796.1 LON peptidase substrate-binding domain-containing protein [Alkalimonas sp. MEB004]
MSEQLALFPLNCLLLPEGKTRLRVFEPRYIRLVKEATAGKRAFAMALLNPLVSQTHPDRVFSYATKVQVTDFDVLSDGLLGIEVLGLQRVRILNRWQEDDKLHVADTEAVPFWPAQPVDQPQQELQLSFDQLLKREPELASLYPEMKIADASWLAARWLELLPLPPLLKEHLAEQATPEACLHYLQRCLKAESI